MYAAKLLAVEPVTNDQYGAGIKFTFQVVRGPHAGQKVARTTGCSPSLKNSLGKLLSGMLGRTLSIDEEVEVEDLIGREFMVVVAITESGGCRVETATPPPTD
jgi:hypothetical protein